MFDAVRRSIFFAASGAACLLAAPLAHGGEGKSAPVVYKCPDGSQIVAIFSGSQKASLSLSSGEVLSMASAVSGSGARYLAPNGDEFWTHRDEGSLTRGGRTIVCVTK